MEELAKYGLTGIAIALIMTVIYIVKIMYKLVSNHINHSTEAINKNSQVITGLQLVIVQSCDILKELKNEIQDMRK